MAKEPQFFWRGVMVLAPVLVLTVLGLYSLKQDRLLAEAQARERAQELAETFANEILAVLQTQPEGALRLELNPAGKLAFPPPVSTLPTPADPTEATARYRAGLAAVREAREQDALETFESVARDYPEAIGETGLPLKPLAQLKWLELVGRGVHRSADSLSARGTLKRGQTARAPMDAAAVEESLGSNAVHQPTLLTPQILQRLSDSKWRDEWARHEKIRAIHQSARQQLQTPFPPLVWAEDWLLAREDAKGGRGFPAEPSSERVHYICWHANVVEGQAAQGPIAFTASIGAPENWKLSEPVLANPRNWTSTAPPALANPMNRKLLEFAGKLPRYFDYTLDLGGRTIASTNQLQLVVRAGGGKGTGRPWIASLVGSPPSGAFGVASRVDNGAEYLRLGIHLISPEMLYERQRDRALLFGSLIAASLGAAIIGCYSAWRAFERQNRLAQLKSDFVSSVSHELRAPIASVRLMAEGLERGNVTDTQKQHDYYRFIVQECRRLGSMIENVLDFSRIEQGRKEYQFEPTDLPRLVEQTVNLMDPYAAERQVKLVTEIADGVPEAQVDGRAIQQALVNLIDNAIKHSPQGAEVRIGLVWSAVAERSDTALDFGGPHASGRVRSSEMESGVKPPHSQMPPPNSEGLGLRQPSAAFLHHPQACISLSVRDEGPGIPVSERQRIFERFYRCGSELQRETQGVGIGLSIVKHVVDAHTGVIHVISEPGQGSTFTIVLPRSAGLPTGTPDGRETGATAPCQPKDPNEP